MGWKAFKDHYKITHIVHVREGKILLGSPYSSELVAVCMSTGEIVTSSVRPKFIAQAYPEVAAASNKERLNIISQPDSFDASIPIYTFDGPNIIEKLTDETQWPGVTHDGCIIYDNTFSTDKETVIEWAKKDAAIGVRWANERLTQLEKEIADQRVKLEQAKAIVEQLEEKYPRGTASDAPKPTTTSPRKTSEHGRTPP